MQQINELKPLSLGGIFDNTFRLVFENAKLFIILFLIYYLGFFLITFALRIAGNYFTTSAAYSFILNIVSMIISFILFFLFVILISLFIDILSRSFMNKTINIKASLRKVFTKSWIFLFSSFFALASILVGMSFCVFPSLIVFIFFCLYAPAIFYENKGVFTSIGRSFRLTTYSYFSILGMWLLYFLIYFVFLIILGLFSNLIRYIGTVIDPQAASVPLKTILEGNFPTIKITPISVIISIINYIILFIFMLISTIIFCSYSVVIFFNQKIKFENFGIENLAESFIKQENEQKINNE